MRTLDDIESMEKMLCLKAAANHVPISGTFELLPLCNMDCKMCYVKMSKAEMDANGKLLTVKQWINIAEQAKESGLLYLLLTGGEPLLYENFKELYKEIYQLGIVPSLNTNGTMLDDDIADFLNENRPRKVNISLYGASDDTYANLCRNPSGLTQTIRGIQLLQERRIPVKLNCSLTPSNYKEINEMKQLANELKVPIKFANYMFPPLKMRGQKNFVLNRLDYKEAAQAQVNSLLCNTTKEEALEILGNEIAKHKQFQKNVPILKNTGFTCYASKNNFWINWKGEMTACGMLIYPKSNVLDKGFVNAWEDIAQQAKSLHSNSECQKCKNRSHCNYCIASAYAETGEYSGKPEYLCKLTESTIELLEQTYEELSKQM